MTTWFLVDACHEVGPNDVVCCESCVKGSTVRMSEIEFDRHNDDAPVCSCCKVTGCAHCGSTEKVTDYYAESPCRQQLWLCDECNSSESERRHEASLGDAWGAGFAENH